jgi:hypothetical protein
LGWLLGVWMLSSLEIILHSVNSSEDEMIAGYECWVPSKLSPIQSTGLRMRWLWGVWMLSYLEIILHSVNSSEDGMIVGCMNVVFPLKLSSIQSTHLRMGWLLGVWMLSSLWNYPPFSQLEWGQTQSMDYGLTKFIFPFESIFYLSIESLFCLTICFLTHPFIPLSHILFATKFLNFCFMYIVGHFLCSRLMLLKLPLCFSMF